MTLKSCTAQIMMKMESNISRDHIALEAMKMVMDKYNHKSQTIWNKIWVALGGKPLTKTNLGSPTKIAEIAYSFADAMIKEREKEEKYG